ncbi:hypothetical protein N1F78_09000 [Seonamhaeicola sp. MEBiC1930]|uniref:hypothetical protein n=1 Tax=Seonamhaeicola sp. MEBiC01930 TaxID=2976768 RepID=UPI003249BE11
MKKVLLAAIIMLCFLNMQCEEDIIINNCDYLTIVSESEYNNFETDHFGFISTDVEGDCLLVEIGASGCDGSTWEFQLIDSGAIAESFPEQRFLKLQLSNEELCDAYFERTLSFDLTPLRIEGSSRVLLNIDGLNNAIEYVY